MNSMEPPQESVERIAHGNPRHRVPGHSGSAMSTHGGTAARFTFIGSLGSRILFTLFLFLTHIVPL